MRLEVAFKVARVTREAEIKIPLHVLAIRFRNRHRL